MEHYLWLVIVLNTTVDLLLLVGAGALAGHPPQVRRLLPAALLGGIYSGAAAVQPLYFLGNWYWRLVFLGLICTAAFGMNRPAVRKGALFILLRLALDGIATGLGRGGFWSFAAGGIGLFLICVVGFHGGPGKQYLPVELHHRGRLVRLTALHDTGNTLRDPLTGQSVMVVGPGIAGELMGLSREALRSPASTVRLLPGGRLIPYQSVGSANGLLLALRMPDVRIGSWKGSCLVAFAPEGLEGGEFQALTGGIV